MLAWRWGDDGDESGGGRRKYFKDVAEVSGGIGKVSGSYQKWNPTKEDIANRKKIVKALNSRGLFARKFTDSDTRLICHEKGESFPYSRITLGVDNHWYVWCSGISEHINPVVLVPIIEKAMGLIES